MRVYLKFNSDKEINLPLQHNHMIQAMILKYIGNKEYQRFIHDEGFMHKNRKYKMYTFSRIFGRFQLDKINKRIKYKDGFNMVVSSADDRLPEYFLNNTLTRNINLGENEIYLEEVSVKKKRIGDEMKIFTKSPIVVYSTLSDENKKKTYYYSPFETEFSRLIKENIIKKYAAFNGYQPENCKFHIELLKRRKPKERVFNYKGFIIKGWDGEFLIKGSSELLNLAYDTGIGSKNSMGFGCIEICEN